MIILLAFSFLAGLVTILSPCILPILPLVLSGSVTGGKKRPFGVVAGFVLSFSFFTLFLTSIVKSFGVSPNILRNVAVAIVLIFGISLIIPKFQALLEQLFVKFSRFAPKGRAEGSEQGGTGFGGGFMVGLGIGLVWTPCVGPILASVISLALTGTVTSTSFFIVLSYALGTSIPMFAIVYGGRQLLDKLPWLTRNTLNIQKGFGFLMILTAIAIFFNLDRNFQSFVLDKFPNYGKGLTSIEENVSVKNQLDDLKGGEEIDMLGKSYINAPEIIAGGEWFNLPEGKEELKISDLRGKVVLVDFWTYTCINCIRTLPYIQNWHEKYSKDGLVIIGVHTPEFEFEKSAANVSKAISDFGLTYPVVQDNNYKTWQAYNNHYWPAKYLINKEGKIVYTHFGEGDYDQTEEIIQKYLKEAGSDVSQDINNPNYKVESRTPELYLGYGRMGFFATPNQLKADQESEYSLPDELAPNHFAFEGTWKVEKEYSKPSKNSVMVLGYEAKNVFLVMRPRADKPGKVKVYLDDKLIDTLNVDSDRLYTLVEEEKSARHLLKLEFEDDNIEIYAFTFG